MIEKLTYDSDTREQVIDLSNKLNEVIEVINHLTECDSEICKAAKKAATTGNRKDLHEYLRLRRENG